jgi:membrane dipeptidase
MNELGMLIDVAHASEKTVNDVAEKSNAPIMLSHSILKLDEERPIDIRAITPDHAKAVASTGGIIGAWPSGFNTSFEDFIDNILRLIDVAGVDHVGLGTDMDSNYKPVFDSYLQLESWSNALKARGLSDAEVHNVAGGNAVRVLEVVFAATR